MQRQPVAEGPDERTEVHEIPGRGCLVRILSRGPDERWTTTSMCFCPAVRAVELLPRAPAAVSTPEPAPAPSPTPSEGAPSVQPPAAPSSSPAPMALQMAAAAEDSCAFLLVDAAMRNAIIGAFRSKVGVSTGPLGFLDNVPKVGSMGVPGQGDWVWRIDPNTATLRSKNKVVELQLPDHARDDAFDGAALASYMKLTNRTQVGYEGLAYPVDAAALDQLIQQLEQAKLVRVFSKQPTPTFILK